MRDAYLETVVVDDDDAAAGDSNAADLEGEVAVAGEEGNRARTPFLSKAPFFPVLPIAGDESVPDVG